MLFKISLLLLLSFLIFNLNSCCCCNRISSLFSKEEKISNHEDMTSKGQSLSKDGKYHESLDYFEKAISVNPEDSTALEGKKEAINALNSPPVEPAELAEGMKHIEKAFQSNNIKKVMKVVDPMNSANYRSLFEKHPEAFPRIATMLVDRKLIFLDDVYAEYEVTEKGSSYILSVVKYGDNWYLNSL